ncbi:MAG: exodeoxyribonuclease VII large subunit [Kofleriaceae bacterium]
MTASREQPYSIAEILRLAGKTLDQLGLVWVEGEVTQLSIPPSGHMYFSLRDKQAVLPAVMWAKDLARLPFRVEPGMRLRVRGRLNVYERDGKMQFYADFAEPAGFGAEALALYQLKQKLAAEGMFAPEKKRPLPRFPKRIGVVTSKNGAAVRDIITTIQRRFPTPILIADAAVQGPNAPAQLVQGMAMVVRAGVDVLIIGRGGGAVTDLSAFNHERVVRTISRCPVPVVSAVGHEIDLSLADMAADVRAPTPTAAAELCVLDRAILHDQLDKVRKRIDRELRHRIDRANQDLDRATQALHARGERVIARQRTQLQQLAHRLASLHPAAQIAAHHKQLAEVMPKLDAAMRRILEQRHRELGRLGAQMHALSPLAVLDRGYATVMKDGQIIRDPAQVASGDTLDVRLARGTLEVVVKRDESSED